MTKDLENGAISSGKALEALLLGMQEYKGMMDKTANETVGGLWSQITDTFEINVARRWGQGLQDGAKRGFGSIVSLLDDADAALNTFGDTVYEVGKSISNWAADKLEKAVSTIQEIIASDEFKNASLGGKVKMLWDGAIGNPLASWWRDTVVPWWNDTAVPWLAEKGAEIGKGIGEGLTHGILALTGSTDTLIDGTSQGVSIGRSFAEGFAEGFDGSAVTQAIVDAVVNVWEELPWWAKGILMGKAVGGAVGTFNSAVGGAQALAGNMSAIWGTTGTAMVSGTGLSSGLASAGYALTGGAAGSALTGGAAAAVGGGSILGGILGALGIGDALIDFYQGARTNGKERKDRLFQGGTKLAMVGTGAAAGGKVGALIGSAGGPIGTAAGALLGAGIGGLGALFGGDKVGKWLSDKTDNAGEFFTKTVPEKMGEFWDGAARLFTEAIPDALDRTGEALTAFFTETIPEAWGNFTDGLSTFFFEKVPYGIGYATGKVETFFTETLPKAWDSLWNAVGTFFTDTLPEWAGNTWNNNIVPFFTESVPSFFSTLWGAITNFFTETIPTWADSVWNDHIVPFFSETIPGFCGSLWDSVTNFFTESLPTIGSEIWGAASTFFTETIPGWVGSAFENATSWFGTKWETFKSNFTAGKEAAVGGKARGGIVGGASALESFARGGIPGFADGGIVRGGSKLIEVAEEGSPEMIIPLSSQRRERGLELWKKAGEMLGVGQYYRGGRSDNSADERARFQYYGSGEPTNRQSVQINVGGVKIDVHVDSADAQTVAEVIKAKLAEVAEDIAGVFADAFEAQFENTPVRGGA